VLSCGLLDVVDLVWWQPYQKPLEEEDVKRRSTAWLPGAIEITSDPDKAEVGVHYPCADSHAWQSGTRALQYLVCLQCTAH